MGEKVTAAESISEEDKLSETLIKEIEEEAKRINKPEQKISHFIFLIINIALLFLTIFLWSKFYFYQEYLKALANGFISVLFNDPVGWLAGTYPCNFWGKVAYFFDKNFYFSSTSIALWISSCAILSYLLILGTEFSIMSFLKKRRSVLNGIRVKAN